MNLKKAFQYQKQIGKLMTDIVGDDLEIMITLKQQQLLIPISF